ncbi:hypothetical protein HanPSC8_Chr16g0707061 [Helianthus annuus]|nr:hypothetical protein HanPSC8_Chr16g0707061 [Helianthus annuus]
MWHIQIDFIRYWPEHLAISRHMSNSSHDRGMVVGFELSPTVSFQLILLFVCFLLQLEFSSSFCPFLPSNPIFSF